jgi:Flp pilus assembly protein TadD
VHFQDALKCDPQLGQAHNNLGVAEFRLGRFQHALASFNRSLDCGYREADAYANRGAARAALDDWAGAREDFEAALLIDPKCVRARTNLDRLESLKPEH